MSQQNFVIQDSVEYVYRRKHYGIGSTFRHIRRKILALKLYFFLTLFCAGGGALAVYISDFTPPSLGAVTDFSDIENMSMEQKKGMMEKYRNGDMQGLMEQMKKNR